MALVVVVAVFVNFWYRDTSGATDSNGGGWWRWRQLVLNTAETESTGSKNSDFTGSSVT